MKDLKSNRKLTNSEAAVIFATFFHSTYSFDNGKLPELQQAGAPNLIADDIIFDVDKIKLLHNKLPNKYSAGPEEYQLFIEKNCRTHYVYHFL